MTPNVDIFIFPQNFAITQIREWWSQIWQYCFQMPAQKYPNKAFLVPNLSIFVESADFRYNNVVFKSQPKTTQMRRFWSKILHTAFSSAKFGIFVFPQKFFSYTKSGVLISKVTILLSNYNSKITKLGIFGLEFRHFHFFMISNMAIVVFW